jgi:hypothetical protein
MDGLSSPRMMLSSSIGRPSSPSANVDDLRPAPAAAAAGGSRNVVDPLALGAAPGGGGPRADGGGGDESGDDDEEDEMAARRGARRRVGRLQEDVPRVTDATGEAVMTSFQTFLETYTTDIAFPATPADPQPGAEGDPSLYYVEQIKTLKEYEMTTVYVDFSHLLEREEVLARAIQGQYYRCAPPGLQACFAATRERVDPDGLPPRPYHQIPALPPTGPDESDPQVRADVPLPLARVVVVTSFGRRLLDAGSPDARVLARLPQPRHHRRHPRPSDGAYRSADGHLGHRHPD